MWSVFAVVSVGSRKLPVIFIKETIAGLATRHRHGGIYLKPKIGLLVSDPSVDYFLGGLRLGGAHFIASAPDVKNPSDARVCMRSSSWPLRQLLLLMMMTSLRGWMRDD